MNSQVVISSNTRKKMLSVILIRKLRLHKYKKYKKKILLIVLKQLLTFNL